MESRFERRWLRPVASVLALVAVLSGIVYILHKKIDDLLYSYMELQVYRQTEILARDLDGRVAGRALGSLTDIAGAMEQAERLNLPSLSGDFVLRLVDNAPDKGCYGLVDNSGNTVYGTGIDAGKFPPYGRPSTGSRR